MMGVPDDVTINLTAVNALAMGMTVMGVSNGLCADAPAAARHKEFEQYSCNHMQGVECPFALSSFVAGRSGALQCR